MSLRLVPFESLGAVSYSPSLVTVAVSVAVFEIFRSNKNLAIANRSRVSCAQYAEGSYRHKYYTVTLKSRLRVTQGHWKRNHWTDHTRLSSSRVI